MELLKIQDLFSNKYKVFKYHNMKFWQSDEGLYYCQAVKQDTKETYGNIFKLNVEELTYEAMERANT